ncbi:MAG TPA: hypothetical protein VF730_14595 [Terracidiphilus sp.]
MHSFVQIWISPVLKGLLFGLLAMALHEVGHFCAARVVGVKVKRVGLCWKGMYTVREAGPPVKNIQVSLAGPLTNLALMVFWPLSGVFGLANFLCGACNLLPIEGSDGERVMKCLYELQRERLAAREQQQMGD